MANESYSLVPQWSQALQADVCGLSLAREKGWLLAWDTHHWLYLLNHAGQIQAQTRFPSAIAHAAFADDGSALVAASTAGELRWLALDMAPRWEKTLEYRAAAVAVDPLGNFVTAVNGRGQVHTFDAAGQPVASFQSPQPLVHVAFVPARTHLVGCAGFGLVGAFDVVGNWKWREAIVVNVGGLSINGDGTSLLLACFSEGLQRFQADGTSQGRMATPEPCRLVAQSFDGDRICAGGMANQLFLLDRDGGLQCRHELESPLTALAFSALGDAVFVGQARNVVRYQVKRR